jgi:hypothetical protein
MKESPGLRSGFVPHHLRGSHPKSNYQPVGLFASGAGTPRDKNTKLGACQQANQSVGYVRKAALIQYFAT